MAVGKQGLSVGSAARYLGISEKALRLYERQGLLKPERTPLGWRCYGPLALRRAEEIVRFRQLGLGLADIRGVLDAEPEQRSAVLKRHRLQLEAERRRLDAAIARTDRLQAGGSCQAARHSPAFPCYRLELDLPWPWGGERFTMSLTTGVTFLIGPLGSGKTRLARQLADALPGGTFLGIERFTADGVIETNSVVSDPGAVGSLAGGLLAAGATWSEPLALLLAAFANGAKGPLVVDMVEEGLDTRTQAALMTVLRAERSGRPLVLMTRSSAIADLARMESGERIIYCPANHGIPMLVRPDPACRGYEAVATCLADPAVRARTAGVMATLSGARAHFDDSRETFR